MLRLNKSRCCFGEETHTAELSKGQPSLGPTLHKTLRLWRPSETRRSCWGRDPDASDSAFRLLLSLSLSPLWGQSLRRAGCPQHLIHVNGGKLSVCLPQWYTYNVVYSYNVHTTQKTSCIGLDRKELFQSIFIERLEVKEFSYLSPHDKGN